MWVRKLLRASPSSSRSFRIWATILAAKPSPTTLIAVLTRSLKLFVQNKNSRPYSNQSIVRSRLTSFTGSPTVFKMRRIETSPAGTDPSPIEAIVAVTLEASFKRKKNQPDCQDLCKGKFHVVQLGNENYSYCFVKSISIHVDSRS